MKKIVGRETMTRNLHLIVRPSSYRKAKSIAERTGITVNGFFNQILEEAVKNEPDPETNQKNQ